MVKVKILSVLKIFFLLYCLIASEGSIGMLEAQQLGFTSVDVSSQIDAYATFENHPLQGTVSIVHNTKDEVDAKSFVMNGTSLKADLIKSVQMPAQTNVELSIYQFELPGQPKGLYVLPGISVKVGGKVYTSIPTTYEVSGAAPPAVRQPSIPKATLTLQTSVDAPPTIYPGHLLRFVYRYLYTGDIELTTEVLPLLEAKGFQKVGEKKVTESLQNNLSVREVSQEVKALQPGEYNFPASSVEGYGYFEEGPSKKRTYVQPKLHSETSPFTITVNPFPSKGKPISFNGAVGEFTFKTTLLTSPVVHVDDKMQLALDIAGVADLYDVAIPPLDQLKTLFRFSDLTPVGQKNNSTERFVLDLYPLSTAIKEIPSIEFSYLEPLSGHYVTLKSDPIPITVTNAKTGDTAPQSQVQLQESAPAEAPTRSPILSPKPEPTPQVINPSQQQLPTNANIQKPAAVEISSVYVLFASDLENFAFGTWDVLWLIPLGGLIIGFQIWLKRYLTKKPHMIKSENSHELFRKTLSLPLNAPDFYKQLNQALLLRLVERGDIKSTEIVPDDLPTTGAPGEVRAFLKNLEERRFTGNEVLDEREVRANAQQLFDKLSV